ncbi:nuclear transport factor 2 family protein [Nocardiopsis sp. EMB25]|uniref:nuclear transport factor 2 family protein n=1 Tax=Nocardiopsis sp. EMB25 TaxID=2835867 RepID=UPI002283E0F6|nr:nuclear transport factor 2 family protein [Nocardiopsis sp. EMB25]MCY9783729.1 nuclear transport factor 2 family protein [Nocardiopsis sp. EMB25]
MDTTVGQVVAAEMRLLDPKVRASRALAAELLRPDFTEAGKSGRWWDRTSMLAELPTMAGAPDTVSVRVSGMRGTVLAPGVVHLTYTTEVAGARARRSSLWLRGDDGAWRIYHHQGTPAPEGTEQS